MFSLKKISTKFILLNSGFISLAMIIIISLEFLGIFKLKNICLETKNLGAIILILWLSLFLMIILNTVVLFVFTKKTFIKLLVLFIKNEEGIKILEKEINLISEREENQISRNKNFGKYKPKKIKV